MYGRRGDIQPPQKMMELDGAQVARDRYVKSLSSNIFGDAPSVRPQSAVGAAKRFDHGTAEIFADVDPNADVHSRGLKKTPDTFVPRDVAFSANDRKIIDTYGYAAMDKAYRAGPVEESAPQFPVNKMQGYKPQPHADIHVGRVPSGLIPTKGQWTSSAYSPAPCNDVEMDARQRQVEQSVSRVFGTDDQQRENIFRRQSVGEVPADSMNELDAERDMRRVSQNYSNIFNREVDTQQMALTVAQAQEEARKGKRHTDISPYMDAMDSRTELSAPPRSMLDRPEEEVYQQGLEYKYHSHIPGMEQTRPIATGEDRRNITYHERDQQQDIRQPLIDAAKIGDSTAYHNLQMRSTMLQRAGVYDKMNSEHAGEFRVLIATVKGLGPDIEEKQLRDLGRRQGAHVAKVVVDTCPITHSCKGTAKITLRESWGEHSSAPLLKLLEDKGYRVEVEEPVDLKSR